MNPDTGPPADKAPQGLSFEQEAVTHLDVLYRVAQRLCRNETQAQDLVQDTYVKALRFRSSFQPGTSLRAWLFSILKNTFINAWKRDKFTDHSVAIEDLHLKSSEPEIGELGYSDRVAAALAGLPERQRLVLLLSDVEEWSYGEIGQALGCPKNTVGTLLRRARLAMRK